MRDKAVSSKYIAQLNTRRQLHASSIQPNLIDFQEYIINETKLFSQRMLEVNARFKFLVWQELYEVEKPFLCFVDLPEGAEDTRDNNIVLEDREIRVRDIRSAVPVHTLDDHGFMVRSCVSSLEDFGSTPAIEQAYLPEVESLIRKEVEGVDRVWLFDWRVRYDSFLQCETLRLKSQ